MILRIENYPSGIVVGGPNEIPSEYTANVPSQCITEIIYQNKCLDIKFKDLSNLSAPKEYHITSKNAVLNCDSDFVLYPYFNEDNEREFFKLTEIGE